MPESNATRGYAAEAAFVHNQAWPLIVGVRLCHAPAVGPPYGDVQVGVAFRASGQRAQVEHSVDPGLEEEAPGVLRCNGVIRHKQ